MRVFAFCMRSFMLLPAFGLMSFLLRLSVVCSSYKDMCICICLTADSSTDLCSGILYCVFSLLLFFFFPREWIKIKFSLVVKRGTRKKIIGCRREQRAGSSLLPAHPSPALISSLLHCSAVCSHPPSQTLSSGEVTFNV